jgi:hypothetical protein
LQVRTVNSLGCVGVEIDAVVCVEKFPPAGCIPAGFGHALYQLLLLLLLQAL